MKEVMVQTTKDPQKIGQALRWIVSLIDHYAIPYQICGGLAAIGYGATRPLVDIDIYAALQDSPHLQDLMNDIHPYLIRAWGPHLSASWDILYLALNFAGIQIEIAEATSNPRFYNRRDGRWEDQRINFAASKRMSLYGVDVMIMPKGELLAYKAMLDRDVDHVDIEELTADS
jgi:hypothetical protein